jgi:isoleucyl-tRNA synthetase
MPNTTRRAASEVMKYTDAWNELTRKLGYWVDMDHPYITYDNTLYRDPLVATSASSTRQGLAL